MRAENVLYSRENAERLVGRELSDDEYYYNILESVIDKVDIEDCDGCFVIGENGVYTNGNKDYLSKKALKILSDSILEILENYKELEQNIITNNEKTYLKKCEQMKINRL